MKKGFTLIELLIVIGIIGILATVSIGSYAETRKSAELGFAIEGVISDLRAVQNQSASIEVPKCMGLIFKKNANENYIAEIEAEYKNPIEKCGIVQEIKQYSVKDLEIVSLKKAGTTRELKETTVLFFPPKAEMLVGESETDNITIKLALGTKQNNQAIVINPNNGTIQKIFE